MEHVLCICTTGTLLWYINRTITQHHPSSSVSPVDTHRHTYIRDVLHIYVFTHAHACSPVDCDLPALTTELWLTGCYRSHLRPLTVCTGSFGHLCLHKRRDWGEGRRRKWCVDRVPTAWTRVRGRERPSPNKGGRSSSASVWISVRGAKGSEVWEAVGMNGCVFL